VAIGGDQRTRITGAAVGDCSALGQGNAVGVVASPPDRTVIGDGASAAVEQHPDLARADITAAPAIDEERVGALELDAIPLLLVLTIDPVLVTVQVVPLGAYNAGAPSAEVVMVPVT
jgi:hypothetical protein